MGVQFNTIGAELRYIADSCQPPTREELEWDMIYKQMKNIALGGGYIYQISGNIFPETLHRLKKENISYIYKGGTLIIDWGLTQ